MIPKVSWNNQKLVRKSVASSIAELFTVTLESIGGYPSPLMCLKSTVSGQADECG